jgi:hypothetical protein
VALGDRAGRFSDLEFSRFAEVLKDDAILLGLFAKSLKDQPDAIPLALAQDVIGNWVEHATAEVATKWGLAPSQYRYALGQLSSEMIRRKVLYPKWAELEGWFGAKAQILSSISQLAAQGAVCRVSNLGGSDEFQFRHDRILEYHLRLSFREMLAQDPQDESVWDPFFVPYIAWTLAAGTQPSSVLEMALQIIPVALIGAVERLPEVGSRGEAEILAKAREWINTAPTALPSVRDDAYGLLASIESPHVLGLTDGVGNDQRLLFGRLRNGDAAAGVLALSKRFYPATRHPWLETLVQQSKLRYGSHLVSELALILAKTDLDDARRSGALSLAGYLGDDSLATAARKAWENAPDRNRFLVETLWATLRCSGSEPEKHLPPIISAILEVADGEHRRILLEEVQFAGRHGFSCAVLKFLAALGERDEYEETVVAVLDRVDHPIAIEFEVKTLAFWRRRAREQGGMFPWADIWTDRWTRGEGERPIPLSSASVGAIRALWQEESNPDWLREYALDVWAKTGGELRHLQSIPDTSPLYTTAVWHRAQKGDRDVVSQVVAMLEKKTWWLSLLPKVWCKAAEEAADYHLTVAESNEIPYSNLNYSLAEMLRDIPVADAERLLFKHWPKLSRIPLYIQAALYLSTHESRSRAGEAIRTMGADARVFEHVSMFFGFMVSGLSNRISIGQLESLAPYVHRLEAYCIEKILSFCERHGYRDWATKVLQPECSRRAKAAETREYNKFDWDFHLLGWHFPTDADLLDRLDTAAKVEPRQRVAELWRWSEGFAHRGDPPDRPFRLAEHWLQRVPSLERFKIVAGLVEERGTRQHLSILQSCATICGTPEGSLIFADVSYAVRRRSLA